MSSPTFTGPIRTPSKWVWKQSDNTLPVGQPEIAPYPIELTTSPPDRFSPEIVNTFRVDICGGVLGDHYLGDPALFAVIEATLAGLPAGVKVVSAEHGTRPVFSLKDPLGIQRVNDEPTLHLRLLFWPSEMDRWFVQMDTNAEPALDAGGVRAWIETQTTRMRVEG